jgi:hypothetical protein
MAETYNAPSIDEYLRKRLMPVEGAIPHVQGIEMYGNSIPAGAVGGDLFGVWGQTGSFPLSVKLVLSNKYQRTFRLSPSSLSPSST